MKRQEFNVRLKSFLRFETVRKLLVAQFDFQRKTNAEKLSKLTEITSFSFIALKILVEAKVPNFVWLMNNLTKRSRFCLNFIVCLE